MNALERSEEDRLNDSRALTTAELLKAGAEHREGLLMVSETVQNRIKHVGDLVYAKIEAVDSEGIEAALAGRMEKEFSGRDFLTLTNKDVERLLQIAVELGAYDVSRIRRRLPQNGQKAGILGYSSWGEFIRGSIAVVEAGIRYRRENAVTIFDRGAFLHDKTYD